MLRALLQELIDALIPPRGSERLVRALRLSDLRALYGEDALPYADPRVTALIWEIKYYKNARALSLAGALLAETILSSAAEELGVPLLVPIPMHSSRRHERGHNHTESLCRAALKRLGNSVDYAPGALVRTSAPATQQGLPRSKRLANVRGSMEARDVSGRACIILDDVTTTGATLAEAKRALALAGARSVQTVVLARS